MTGKDRCGEVERLVLEAEDRALGAEERRAVEEHLGRCGRCREFADGRALIRGGLAAVRWPEPPAELVRRTRLLAREAEARSAGWPARVPLPAWVLTVLAAVTVATGLWLAMALAGVRPDATLSELPVAARAAVLVIAQNTLTLLFAPVVLRAFRARREAAAGVRET